MAGGFQNDAFQWKNSAHKESSIGFGARADITDRDVDNTRDYLQQLLQPDQLNKLESNVCLYSDHFAANTTIDHRESIRELSDKIFTRACEELLNKYVCDEQNIANAERLKLENRLCELRTELNSVAGSTRNAFSGEVIAHTLSDNSITITGLLAQLRHDAITRETDALQNAYAISNNAYNEADQLDFNKYIAALQTLRGSWNKIDYTDNTDEDIRNFTTTAQYNRSAGSISDVAGDYDGDIATIEGAGDGLALPIKPA